MSASDMVSLSAEADVAERLPFEMDRSFAGSIRSFSVGQAAEIQLDVQAPHGRIVRLQRVASAATRNCLASLR